MTYNTLIFFHGQRINPLKIHRTGHWSVNTMAEMDIVTYVVHQRWRRRDVIGITKPWGQILFHICTLRLKM